jgi:hypothetical protein
MHQGSAVAAEPMPSAANATRLKMMAGIAPDVRGRRGGGVT